MSLAELKHKVERLSPEERRHLTAHLVVLERKDDPGFRRELARKIDDDTPDRWVLLEDAEKRLGS